MDTLKIVCPHCKYVNHIINEIQKNEIACEACKKMLTDTKPVLCDVESLKLHLSENDIPVLVDFYSPDCTPCMDMAPDYNKAADSFALEVRFLKVNTIENAEIALQYGVNELPTIIAFNKGIEINRFSSKLSKEQLGMWAESLIQMTL